MAGLGVVVGGGALEGDANAADEQYAGPLWITIHAGGGWDVTSLCDPKGATGPMDPDPMNHYLQADIGTAGAFQFAPDPDGANAAFFEKYKNRLMVINGIDTQTNSHDVGTRCVWSGSLIENRPSFSALVAAHYGAKLPMGFISNGGYDITAGVVAVTRVGDQNVIQRVAYPDIIDPIGDANKTPFHAGEATKRLLDARYKRQEAYLAKQHLPRLQHAMSTLFTARLGQNELKKLNDFLPPPDQLGQGLRRQVNFALAAYQAGICISANLSTGGFDTHGNNDDQQFPRLAGILDAIDFLMLEAEKRGIGDKVVAMAGSDFGRTPGYNPDNGKDHWNITSMLLMGTGIPGGRLVGVTDERHKALKVDPNTLQPSDSGITIKPGHIHHALRKLAGINDSQVLKGAILKEDDELATLFT
jgi:hypothetical protein